MKIIRKGTWPKTKPQYRGVCNTCDSDILAEEDEVQFLTTGVVADCPVCENKFLLMEIKRMTPPKNIKCT